MADENESSGGVTAGNVSVKHTSDDIKKELNVPDDLYLSTDYRDDTQTLSAILPNADLQNLDNQQYSAVETQIRIGSLPPHDIQAQVQPQQSEIKSQSQATLESAYEEQKYSAEKHPEAELQPQYSDQSQFGFPRQLEPDHNSHLGTQMQYVEPEITRDQSADEIQQVQGHYMAAEIPGNPSTEAEQVFNTATINPAAERWPGWPGENAFRLLVPVHKVGTIIGRKGEFVKRMSEETKARIKVIDGLPGVDERVVLISAKEEPDLETPPAVVGTLRVQRQVVEGPEVDPTTAPSPELMVGSIVGRLLMPMMQAASLIGRQGVSVKAIQEESGAMIKVLPFTDSIPPYALEDDRIVEISGPVLAVYKATRLILSHLRRFLVDKSVIPVFELPRTTSVTPSPAPTSWGSAQAVSQARAYNTPSLLDRYAEQYSNRSEFEAYANQSLQQRAPSLYGRDSSARQSVPLLAPVVSIKEVTATMKIPLPYVDAVMGVNGANIVHMRRVSGATVTVKESVDETGAREVTVEIRGSSQQVQAAEQTLQSFVSGQTAYQAPAAAATLTAGQVSGYSQASTYSQPAAYSQPTAFSQPAGFTQASGQYTDQYAQYGQQQVVPTTQTESKTYEQQQQEYYARAVQYGTTTDAYGNVTQNFSTSGAATGTGGYGY